MTHPTRRAAGISAPVVFFCLSVLVPTPVQILSAPPVTVSVGTVFDRVGMGETVTAAEDVTEAVTATINPTKTGGDNEAKGATRAGDALPNIWLSPTESDPMVRVQSSATYRVTFQGNWTTASTPGGVVAGAHFTTLIGAIHNDMVTFWESGGTATPGVENVAELGSTGTFKSEINANSNAISVIEKSVSGGGTSSATFEITPTSEHPLVTLLSMIGPSPDWFVGVSGLSLLDTQGEWESLLEVDLFPYDAGTEEGTEFSLNNQATSPQGVIASIKGMGKFSNVRMARLTFTRQSFNTTPSFTSDSSFEVDENRTAVATVVAEDPDRGDEVTYAITGAADASKFEIDTATGVLTFKTPPNYERPADVASTDPLNDSGNNEYIATVTATSGTADRAMTAEQTITVTVGNLEEAGWVSFSRVGAEIRAKLSDPDGGVSGASWQWARSSNGHRGWVNIDGATSASYTPSSDDEEMYLRARVSYEDGQGSGKQAQGVSTYEITPPNLVVSTPVSGLSIPWDLAFTPDGTMLFTQRAGVLSSRLADGTVGTVDADFAEVLSTGENGLMGIVVDPDFASNRRFYTCQTHVGPEMQVIAWTIDAAYTIATRVADPLVGDMPTASSRHGGCRLRFGPEGYLWIATGDAATGTVPQDLTSLGGKVLRVDPSTGAGAPTNPFAPSRVYTYGHRNMQGLALRPGTSQMWSVEHGPAFDDEINLLVAGRNYGWDPVPGYNQGVPMTDLVKFPDAVEAQWSSGSTTLATSGGIFLEGAQWGVWEGRLAVATLKDSKLRLFEFTPEGDFVSQVVVSELDGAYGRLRTPMMGPDGALYVTTSNGSGQDRILRIIKDEAVPVTLKLTPDSIGEKGGISTVTANLERASNAVTTVVVSAEAISPAVPGDFTLSANRTLRIAAGERSSSGEVTIGAVDNILDASDKMVTVSGTAENINGVTPPSAVTLRIVDDDASPVITTTSPILVVENQKAVATLTATDADRPAEDLAWAITGGADRNKFILTADGELDFTAAKDYEDPDDADRDHDYEVTVQVSDGANPVEGALTVRLLDVDDSAPMLSPPTVNGTMLTLTYDEPLDGSSTPEAGDFTVTGGDRARTVSRVVVRGMVVLLTLDAGAEHGEAGIQVSYTPWNNPIRDVPGNEAEGLSREPVTNETPDTTTPRVESLGITSNPGSDQTYAAGDEIEVRVRFSEKVEVEGTPRLRLRVGNRTRPAGYLRGTGTAAPVFAYEVADGDEDTDGVSVNAGRIALNGGTIEDGAENAAELDHEALAAQAGHKVDGVRPAFVSAAVDGSSLTLTYGEGLDGGSRPASGDFTVEVGGSGRSASGVSVSGSVVTLTLNPAVEHGDTGIRVSYSPGTNPLRDAVGNEARGLSSQSVTNTTGAPNTAPEITSPSSINVPENQLMARRLVARDTDAGDDVTGWEIVGGADQSRFAVTSDTGDLSFRTAPDFEAPGDNEYEVTVEVKSGAGARELEAEQTFTIRVTDEREPPGVPEAPAISGETAEGLQVSWSEPENTGPAITDYDAQYREKGTGRFTGALHDGPGRTVTLSDLNAGTVYEVQVRATNDEGTGGWSDPGEGMTVAPLRLEMMTMEEPPVSGPFTVRFSFSEPVTGFSASDIETGQDPACVDDQNNTVFCDPGIGGVQTADDRVFTSRVTPRTDGVADNYTLRLRVPADTVASAVGNKPNEEAMLEVRVATPGGTLEIGSLNLSASPGSGSVRLSWNRPSDNGGSAIIRYEVRNQAVGEAWSEWEKVGAGSRGVAVGNLVNGREYVFEVRAVNALGKGGAETVQATPERRIAPPPPPPPPPGNGGGGGGLLFPPEAPAGLMAMAGEGAVRLEWGPPESDGGAPILRYEYRLKEGRGAFGEWTAIEDSAPDEVNATGYTVGELGNGTVYVFELRAVNLVGGGPESEAVEAVMGLDRAYWSNFGAEDLQGGEASLEGGPFGETPQSLRLRFGAGLRFEESELDGDGEVTGTRSGSYGYRYTSRTTGELRLDYDGGESCELRLTFRGVGAGSYRYRCGGVLGRQGSFRMSGLNRGPEITSAGAYEVAENTVRVGRLEAVDGDDEIGGYGVAGGADGGLFAVVEETGELMFREAPDYEDPSDVESAEPASGAADNEYIVVVEVRSGEGERERRGSRAIRVRVSDEEEPPEITSLGPFEVVENRTRVGQLEAVDQDKQDEITEYGIAGGADGGLFAVVEETGELMFREAPDYEDPSDVESAEPASGAGDNEYIVVVEVRSGEGERERKGSRAIRVRVADEEEPPGAPGAPVVTAEGSDSLQVSWTEPENRGPEIVDYEVRYREGGEEGYSDGGHEGTGLEVRLSGLEEGTAYEVQVRAVNQEGMSEWSEPGEGRTDREEADPEEADPEDPSDFTEGDLEGRRLRLRLEGEEGTVGSLELRFGEGNRFEQIESVGEQVATQAEGAASRSGSYSYQRTGSRMGTLSLAYDDGSSCEVLLAFTEAGAGTFSYDCGGGDPAEGSFRLTTGSLFVPVILSAAGRSNSLFTSELTLTNRGDEEVKLDYTYTAHRGGGSGKTSDVLAPGRQRVETDALTYLRGLGIPIPETGNRIGTLRVEVRLGSEVEAVVRTTTVVPDGRAGLAYLGVAEEEGFEEAVYLCGLRQNSQDRSNVTFQNMGAPEEGAITVRTTVYSGESTDTNARVLEDIELEPGGFHQYSGLLGVLESVGGDRQGYVRVERVEGTAPFYAYGVINDQANSDGSFVFPVTASWLEGAAGQTLPVIVETSEFTSELTVTNFSGEARRLDFQFVAERIEADDKAVPFSMTLEAGQQEIVEEVVDELRRLGVAGLGSTRGFYAGPLFVVAEGGDMSGIVIGARTGSQGGSGQYSVFYNAVPEGAGFSQVAWVDGLQQNQENRSNLALVNTGEVDGSASVFHLEIYDGETGLLAETVVTKPIPARRWHQINGILGSYAPETRQGYIRIEKVSGENPFLAYGVVNDGGAPGERSGDGAYLPARE